MNRTMHCFMVICRGALPVLLLGLGSLGFVPCTRAQESLSPVAWAQLWNDPTFVARFLGDFGVRSDIEPRITTSEHRILTNLVALARSDPQGARARLQSEIAADSQGALYCNLGNLALRVGDPDAAIAAYTNALRKFPDFMRVHKGLGLAYVRKGEYDKAIAAYVRTLELGGEDGNVYGLVGYCYLQEEKYLSAEAAYRKALLFAPDTLDWKLGLARCSLVQEAYKTAVLLFDELIQRDPGNPDYWIHQANAYIGLEQPMKAARNYEILQRLGKADTRVLNNLGDVYLSQGMPEMAVDTYLLSLSEDRQQDVRLPIYKAEVIAVRGSMGEAERLVQKIRETYQGRLDSTNQARLLRVQARVKLATGDDAAAVETLEALIQQDPLDGDALLLLAAHYGRQGEVERAEFYYGRVQQLSGFEWRARVERGQMLVREGRYAEAIQDLRRAQEIDARDNVAAYLEQVERLARATR